MSSEQQNVLVLDRWTVYVFIMAPCGKELNRGSEKSDYKTSQKWKRIQELQISDEPEL